MNSKIKQIFLLFGDISILYFSLYLTLLIRYWGDSLPWENHIWHFSIIFVAWITIFYISNLYSLNATVSRMRFFQTSTRTIGIAGLISVLYFYTNSNIGISPKTNLIIFIIVFTCTFLVWRYSFNWILGSYIPKNNIGIIGYNEQVKELAKTIHDNPNLGYNISFIVRSEETEKFKNLKDIIKKNNISTIIITSSLHHAPELRRELFKTLPLKINIINLVKFYEIITGKVPIEAINQMWFLENLAGGSKKWMDIIKRGYDVVIALLVLAVTIIFWPIIGFIIKKESDGPVFFKQVRSGKNGEDFTILKFRTMTTENNDHSLTTANDNRVTRFGKFLRKTRIDELPQVINILIGEMSLVGPRPERPEFIEELKKEIPFYEERMLVKPGLTGWDQISGEYHSPTKEDSLKKLQYDLFYVKNRSVYLDMSIILKTIATVLSKAGV